MSDPAKKALSERDICTKYITPALIAADKWDSMTQITTAQTAAEKLLDATLHQILAA
jgi:hypothetical protein